MSKFANLLPLLSYCRTSNCVKASRFDDVFCEFVKTLGSVREILGNVDRVTPASKCDQCLLQLLVSALIRRLQMSSEECNLRSFQDSLVVLLDPIQSGSFA